MLRRPGAVMDMRAITKEVVGAIAFILILSLLFVHFFGTDFGCYTNQNCMETREAMERFVDDLNRVCQQGEFDGDNFLRLNQNGYDFSNVDRIKVAEGSTPGQWYTNTFTFEGNGFELQRTAEDCSQAKFCRDIVSIEVCEAWYEEGFSDSTLFEFNIANGDNVALRKLG
jgi:hypothetical protein